MYYGTLDEKKVRIIVENTSSYAVRTPAVIVKFTDAAILAQGHDRSPGWTPVERDAESGAICALQWDGGPNYAIHGQSHRHLPDLYLKGLSPAVGLDVSPKVTIRLLAGGYNRPSVTGPLKFAGSPESGRHAEELPPEWL